MGCDSSGTDERVDTTHLDIGAVDTPEGVGRAGQDGC